MKTYRIKPLEWVTHANDMDVSERAQGGHYVYVLATAYDGSTRCTFYARQSHSGDHDERTYTPTIEAAKAAAQAHHEAYIKQFLVEVTGEETETALAYEEKV